MTSPSEYPGALGSRLILDLDPHLDVFPDAHNGVEAVARNLTAVVKSLASRRLRPSAVCLDASYFLGKDSLHQQAFVGQESLSNLTVALNTLFAGVPLVLSFRPFGSSRDFDSVAQALRAGWNVAEVWLRGAWPVDPVASLASHQTVMVEPGVWSLLQNRAANVGVLLTPSSVDELEPLLSQMATAKRKHVNLDKLPLRAFFQAWPTLKTLLDDDSVSFSAGAMILGAWHQDPNQPWLQQIRARFRSLAELPLSEQPVSPAEQNSLM